MSQDLAQDIIISYNLCISVDIYNVANPIVVSIFANKWDDELNVFQCYYTCGMSFETQ